MNHRIYFTCGVLALAAALLFGGVPEAGADQWGLPPSEYRSANGRFVLKVDADHATFSLRQKGAKGTLVRWSARYPDTGAEYGQPAPVAAFITDDGRYVVLRDVWGAVGEGNVLMFLGPRGNLLAAYTLEQLLTHHGIYQYVLSVSSLWWSERGLFFLRPGQTQFAFVTRFGTLGLFDLATGKPVPLTPGRRNGVRVDALKLAHEGLASRNARARETGATIAGALHDQPSVPRLKELLNDPSSAGTIGPPMYPFYEVQAAAGEALVALLGRQAAPLLERKLTGANPQMARHWTRLLGTLKVARWSPGVAALARDQDATTRLLAVMAMLEGDTGAVARAHPEWLRDPDDRVRWEALNVRALRPRTEDAAALRAALSDTETTCAEKALQGLVRLNPPDLEEVLRACLQRGPYLAYEATMHLAKRGDAAALSRIVGWVRSLRTSGPEEGTGWGLFEVTDMCRLLVRARPPGTQEALLAATASHNARTQCDAFGALAALGDARALARVRDLARAGDYLDRAHAIDWLGVCRDRESRAFLQEQLRDREPTLREAAQRALEAMEDAR